VQTSALGIRFSATDLTTFLACEHASWLEGQVAFGLIPPPVAKPDPMLERLLTRGQEYERAYLAQLETGGAQVVRIPYQPDDPAGGVAATKQAVADGAQYIYQAVLEGDGWFGLADFLEKVGDGRYEVADTKLGRNPKPEYLLQLSLYSDLLTQVQGSPPEFMHVLLASERVSYRVREYSAYVRALRERLAKSIQAEDSPYPFPVEHCSRCRWTLACEERWRLDDHLSGVASIRRGQIARLEAAGVTTMAALAVRTERVPQMAADTLATLVQQARLQVAQRTSGTPSYELLPPSPGRGFALLPAPDEGDVFFDMEGDPYVPGGLEYMFGWEAFEDGAWRYDVLWGHDANGEQRAFEKFIDFLVARRVRYPEMHVYHYAAYEPTALKRLAGRYGTREDALDDLLRGNVFVDLFRVVRQGLRASFPSYSIKDIEHFYMTPRAADVKDAGSSIVAYENWIATGDAAILESIRAYNAEDCASTRLLRDWLLPLKDEAWRRFGEPAPPPEQAEPEPKDPAKAEAKRLEKERILAETLELERRLIEEGDLLDAPARTLLAHLLEYHQREARPVWWAYFDRIRMLPDQLLDDSEAIGGLELDTSVEPYKEKLSMVYTFKFPAQEFKLSSLGDARDQDGLTTGTLINAWLEADGGHATLKRGPRFKDRPQPQALIPGEPIRTDAQRDALRRLARSVVAKDGRYRVLLGLLRKEAPRVIGLRAGEPLQGLHLDVDLAWNVLEKLDESALVMQGPPGSGKTYTGARLIVRLLREGRKVGITAPTHRVIHHVLEEVEKVAIEEGVAFRGVKKCNSDDDESAYQSLDGRIINVKELDGVPDGVQLVTGTAWLFPRPGFDRALDFLFIDEAGQFSLADAVAVGTSARNLVLLGDPQQMPQDTQGTHPEGAGASVLEHALDGHDTVPPERGLFLDQSWRMHPDVCRFISELAYETRLESAPRCTPQRIDSPRLSGTGLRFLPVEHAGNRQRSKEEAKVVAREIEALLADGTWTDHDGKTHKLTTEHVLVVAPYNAQVQELLEVVPDGVRVGTVDKFQGQEAPVVFYSMATSSGEDLPRDLAFLFSRNRLNVAISRAKALAILVASPRLLQVSCKKPAEMRLVNGVARFVELSAKEGK
jgi:uncharacterized protein